ncbi:MAG: OmpA family protein [Elusimicrobiota bacterium]|nr:OmpA family protein [Elusimicrobiota bacterium]
MAFERFLVVAALLGAPASSAFGQEDAGGTAGLSRPMQLAIGFYEKGDDMQAMDRFMEILTKGDPAERSMANEYLNLITHRMNASGGKAGSPSAAKGDAVVEAAAERSLAADPSLKRQARRDSGAPIMTEGESNSRRARDLDAVDEPERRSAPRGRVAPSAPRGDDMSASNKAVMRKEIRARLRNAQEKSLSDLKSIEGVRVVMRENGDPEAIGIPTTALFQSGIAFHRDASKVLDPLTKLAFALGSTQVVILPEGTAIGDAKVLDMRRTMGISAHMFSAGVAPPRVRVNLLNTQVDIPKGLLDFKGIVAVFVYNQPLTLAVESAVGDELGPPISLGVFPPQFRPARNQGVVIEFSVSDPPAGLVSWKFQLLQPSRDGMELTPLQEVVGGGPVFHQIFWNGRQGYFGSVLPAGRYETVLTATDTKNRQRSLHRWINLIDDGGSSEKLLSDKEPAGRGESPRPVDDREPVAAVEPVAASPSAPSADLGGAAPLVKGMKAAAAPAAVELPAPGSKAAKTARRVVSRPVRGRKSAARADKGREARATEPKAAAPAPEAAADDAPAPAPQAAPKAPEKPAKPASGRFELPFNKDTHQMSDAANKALGKAASTIAVYPLENLRVVGHAAPDEKDAAVLAERRAQMVASLLINRYQVEPKRIQVSSAVSDAGAKVDLEFAGGE